MKKDLLFKDYIGVFDSGVGGISILNALRKRLPNENYVYFGDTKNSPYGDRELSDIRDLSVKIADRLTGYGVKCIVIACNTATSAAAETIRKKYPDIPVIGEEPALKPACEALPGGRILIMATEATLKLEKFEKLFGKYKDSARWVLCNCKGLADLIETGDLDSPELNDKLHSLLDCHRGNVDGVVLGCTHYPLIMYNIMGILGNVPVFDGGEGTAKELERQLKQRNLLKNTDTDGEVVLMTSSKESRTLDIYREFLE